MRAAWCLALCVAACSTRRPQAQGEAPPTTVPAVELRAAHGELLAQLRHRPGSWELRAGPGRDAPLDVLVSPTGAEVRDRDGRTVASLLPAAAGFALAGRDGKTLRVTLAQPHGVARVLDAVGVTLVAIDGATARDGAAQLAATLSGAGDRLVIEAPDGAPLKTVHNLPRTPTPTWRRCSSRATRSISRRGPPLWRTCFHAKGTHLV